MVIFILLIAVLCVGVWFLVRKNDQTTSEACSHHSPYGGMVMPVKKDQPKETSQKKQAAPTEVFEKPENERWRDWLALSTTIIAVVAIIMALEATRASTLAVISSGKETNTWSFFQGKSAKESGYQLSKATLELQLEGTPGISAEAAEKYRKEIKKYDEELKRYKDEKDEIMEQAKALGKTKEKNQRLSAGFTNSLVFLQIAIVLSSIATMVRKKYIWYISFSMLAGWLYFLVNSF